MEKAFQRSFDNLNLDYIDLYLIHCPVSYRRVLLNIRLPSDDVNAFHAFPVDKDGKDIRCLISLVAKLFLTTTKTFCNAINILLFFIQFVG